MNESTNVLSWPISPGYVTVKPLSAKSPCKVWLLRRERDQSYMVLKLSLTMENVTSLRQNSIAQTRKYVVEFYGTLSTQLGDGLLMEYCPGGSLADLVHNRGVFSLGECITALAPVAQTVSVMHSNGTRHGDLSPANVLLTASGMPKIIDFQESATAEQEGSGAGTPGFLAPESRAGALESQVGEQDVYSLATCLWFLLSGQPPDPELIRPPASVKFPMLPEILHELLIESLNEDPGCRPTAEQFARTLFSCADAEPIHWEGHVSEEATHLMETIHPDVSGGQRRNRSQHKQNRTRYKLLAGSEASANLHKLRRTPGGIKVAAALVLGLSVLGGSLVGVNHLRAAIASDPSAKAAAPLDQPSCRIDDAGHEPACIVQQDTVTSAFLDLTKRRDDAMSAMNEKKLKTIYAPGSAQLKRDLETISTLREMKLIFDGLGTRMEDVTVTARGQGNTVMLAATSTQSDYAYQDLKGKHVHTVKSTGPQRVEIELVLIEEHWRIGKVIRR